MKIHVLPAIVLGLALGAVSAAAPAQDAATPPQTQTQRGGWAGGMMGAGRMGGGQALMGTVTQTSTDHYTIQTDAGETYTVHFSANTRILKQMVRRRSHGASGESGDQPPAGPQPLKPADIKVGDVIAADGEVDAAARSVGAVFIVQLDPERAQQMRAMRASFGKTWLMGKVTAVDGVKVTLDSSIDKAAHTFVADENTTFRKRREPITLADVQVGDMVRVEGAVKDGVFVAASVAVMGMPQGGTPMVPRGGPAQ